MPVDNFDVSQNMRSIRDSYLVLIIVTSLPLTVSCCLAAAPWPSLVVNCVQNHASFGIFFGTLSVLALSNPCWCGFWSGWMKAHMARPYINPDAVSGQCVESCQITNSCSQCNVKCSTCYNSADNSCLSCPKGRVLNQKTGECISTDTECFLGEYASLDLTTNAVKCLRCDASCAECSGPLKTDCTKCQDS